MIENFTIRSFLGSAVSATFGQIENWPHEWGQGAEGFGDRYASAFGESLARGTFEFGMEVTLHEDPRYFPSDERAFGPRMSNVIKQIFVCKKDSGEASFAYSRVISAFAAGELTNTWQPRSTRSFGEGVERGFISLGADGALNLAQEFLRFTRPRPLRSHQ